MDKTQLKIKLSQIKDFENPRISMEQYLTPSEVATDLIYSAYMQGDIERRKVADLGAGTGMLGIGALLAGGEVLFVEKEQNALELLKSNLESFGFNSERFKIVDKDVNEFDEDVDTVVMNPPFSTHSDLLFDFWGRAFELADSVYGVSHSEGVQSIKNLAEDYSFSLKFKESYKISLPPSYGFHTEQDHEVPINILYFKKDNGE